MSNWDGMTTLARSKPNDNEPRALGEFLATTDVDPSTYEFIQTEGPVGLQRVAAAFGIEINPDRSLDDILRALPRETSEFPEFEFIDIDGRWGPASAVCSSLSDLSSRDWTVVPSDAGGDRHPLPDVR